MCSPTVVVVELAHHPKAPCPDVDLSISLKTTLYTLLYYIKNRILWDTQPAAVQRAAWHEPQAVRDRPDDLALAEATLAAPPDLRRFVLDKSRALLAETPKPLTPDVVSASPAGAQGRSL